VAEVWALALGEDPTLAGKVSIWVKYEDTTGGVLAVRMNNQSTQSYRLKPKDPVGEFTQDEESIPPATDETVALTASLQSVCKVGVSPRFGIEWGPQVG
jgi:hypothetical protein